MQKKLYSILRNTSVFKRLWISTITVAFIPTFLISALLLLVFWNNLNARTSEYAGSLSFQMASYMELQIQQLNNDITNFSIMDNTADFLKDYAYMDRRERYLAQKRVQADITSQFGKLYDISDIILLTNDLRNTVYIYGSTDHSAVVSPEKAAAIIADLIKHNTNTFYDTQTSGNGGLIIAKRIVNHNTGFIQGYILVQMRETFLSTVYRDLDARSTTSDIYIINAAGTVMSSSQRQDVGLRFPQKVIDVMITAEGVLPKVSGISNSESYLCAYSRLNTMPAMVLCLVHRNYLANDMLSVSLVVFLVGAVLILLASGASTLVMKSITMPISNLISRMRMVQNDRLVVGEPDMHTDELAVMNNTYNETVLRLRRSIEDIQRAEQEKVALELRVLSAQINPHFITNTLNTIRMLAQIQNARNVESMVGSLINILSARLRKHDALVPLIEESMLLQDYINLQNYRCITDISIDISIDESVRNCLIPVFTLQPLVENSFRHGGLDARIDGWIIVKAYRVDDDVHILVSDNGAGISQQRLREVQELCRESTQAPTKHIGIQNINQRIRLLFGGNYGLTIASEQGLFTEVDICIPFQQHDCAEPVEEESKT